MGFGGSRHDMSAVVSFVSCPHRAIAIACPSHPLTPSSQHSYNVPHTPPTSPNSPTLPRPSANTIRSSTSRSPSDQSFYPPRSPSTSRASIHLPQSRAALPRTLARHPRQWLVCGFRRCSGLRSRVRLGRRRGARSRRSRCSGRGLRLSRL